MNKILLVILGFVFIGVEAYSQSTIEGKIIDVATGEPVAFATVALYKNGVLKTGTNTDLDGNYFVSGLDPGSYDVEASFLGYTDIKQTGVLLKAGGTTRLNFEMSEGGVLVDEIVVIEYRVPLIEVDNTTTGTVITSEKINSLPVKSINAIVAVAAGVSTRDGEDISIRGSRTNETVYFIDGVRTFGTVPQSEIDQLQLITGGIEAKYGDVTGGIISITTKGPSNKFSGSAEAETSEFLDGYGYNLYRAALSGPIWRNKKGKSILGYRLAAQYRDVADNSPNALGVYRAPESLIAQLEAEPLYQIGSTSLPSAQRLISDDIGSSLKARPNVGNENLNFNAKIDAALGSNIDVSFSGNYSVTEDQFSPRGTWNMFNWTNNPFDNNSRLRTNIRIRHKLGRQYTGESGENRQPSTLRNFEYTLTGGFERRNGFIEDLRHEDRFFDYGHIGNRESVYNPVFGFAPIDGQFVFGHLGYSENLGEFIPGSTNPTLSILNDVNGVTRNENNMVWSDLFQNVGQVYNLYQKTEADLYSFNLNSSFDLLPGGSEKGRHSIQFGLVYEQRTNRSYNLNPFGLWRLGDILVNNHIKGIDRSVVVDSMGFDNGAGGQVFFPIYETLIEEDASSKFYKSIREKLGVGVHEFVNLDGLNPEDLSLDLFSAGELNDQGLIRYRGYDYLGNKLTEPTSFEDFFSRRDEDGRRAFPVAPFTPIYGGVYVQDKFTYKDIIFRLGVRVDYYDANTKVLKDPYAIYEIEGANDFFKRTGGSQPASVGDDYKVYVSGDESDNVIGYRKGDNWFNTSGTEVSGGNVIFNGGVVYPSYVGRFKDSEGNQRELNIQSENFDPNTAFEDYKPQINVMPRLAFSFPISEDAGFFAHYDVLYQRPTANVVATALDYFYFNDIGGNVTNNPNLKPQRTIDYEIGFQQKVSNSAALKLSAYYKAFKDLIQQRAYANVASPINSYFSYGNLDFGNITGFTAQFDRRRTNNLELTATYTLQFANGSGSNANSSGGINNRGPIRNLLPLGFDERHRITSTLDYRYGSGRNYNGPTIGGLNIFEKTGLSVTTIAVSGRPYTKSQTPSAFGGTGFVGEINGSRLPWNFNIDTRLDKTFEIKTSENGKPLRANIYFRVQNILNTKNVRGVYSASGSPTDDGYLLSDLGRDRQESIVRNGLDINAFNSAYSWLLSTSGNYFLPRRMYLGLQFDF